MAASCLPSTLRFTGYVSPKPPLIANKLNKCYSAKPPRKMKWKVLCMAEESQTGEQSVPILPLQPSPSPSSMIKEFYSCMNDKKQDRAQINKFIAENCQFEDLAFPRPFKGKKDVDGFLKKLQAAMGVQVTFHIEKVYEGEQSTIVEGEHPAVGVMWHLDWNNLTIPFTKGCTFYECSRDGDTFVIKNARVFVESPLKPGEIVLELLLIISTLLQKFPTLAERILKEPHAIVLLIVKIYRLFVEPFFLPLMIYYSNVWKYAAMLLAYVINLLQSTNKPST